MKTVLVVEDEYAVASAVADFLAEAGYKAVTASDGREGLARLFECRPQLVILDLMMPVMGGSEMLKSMRAHEEHKATPVIVMTGMPQVDPDLAFDDFILKPFNIDNLLAKVAARRERGDIGVNPAPRA